VGRKALVAFTVYVLACFAFELAERHTFRVPSLRTVRAMKDPQSRVTAIRICDQRVNQMEESIPYLLYLAGSLLGGVGVFVGGLFWMRPKLRPWLSNPLAAHYIYIPLLLLPVAAMMAVMAPPWVVPYFLDGRSWAEFVNDLHAPMQ
jgi:hypothetical protein